MSVLSIPPNFPFGQFENTLTITDGLGTFVNENRANAAETKPYESKTVSFVAVGGSDSQGALVTTASGMPPGINFVDEGSGKLHLVGTPSDSIIPTYSGNVYEKGNGSVSTGGTPSSYTLGDAVNIYKEFTVTVKSKDNATAQLVLPLFVIKDWNTEMNSLVNKVNSEYPE